MSFFTFISAAEPLAGEVTEQHGHDSMYHETQCSAPGKSQVLPVRHLDLGQMIPLHKDIYADFAKFIVLLFAIRYN